VRTGAIALVAFALSFLSRKIGEAQTLAWILLVFGGVKLLAQDLAIGNATSLVVGLALYGGAIVLVAHRRGTTDARQSTSS
jgi:cyanate permease